MCMCVYYTYDIMESKRVEPALQTQVSRWTNTLVTLYVYIYISLSFSLSPFSKQLQYSNYHM